MFFGIFKQLFLIFCFLLLQINNVVKAKEINYKITSEYKNNLFISGWKPLQEENEKKEKAKKESTNKLNELRKISILKPYFNQARGYAVFPDVVKVGFGLGVKRGEGEVFEDGNVIGSTTLTQISLGIQLGGQSYSQIIFFKDKDSLNRFTQGNFEFDASASAVIVDAGANSSLDYSDGVAVYTFLKGGLMYDASIGGQKFNFAKY